MNRVALTRRLAAALAVWLALACWTGPVRAQEAQAPPAPATLVADRIVANPDGTLIAEGAVEIFYDGRSLRAERLTYDRLADTLEITGPIQLSSGPGFVLIASQAELGTDLQEGILQSARLVLDRQVQIAAVEIQRVNGRYTQLYNTVASSCEVCADRSVPLWQIRARRIVHDALERQIYFERAVFEVVGIPVLYLPQMRVPDPTLERATGFLFPNFRTTSALGVGVEIPYFIALGPDRDLTLSPQITTKDSRTLGLRYRQAFSRGNLTFEGAYTRDDLEEGDRGFATLFGAFDLGRDFVLSFDLETVSDDQYYRDYGFDDEDRIDSEIEISRTRRDALDRATASYFTTFREDEDNDTIPRFVLDGEITRRFDTPLIGGYAETSLSWLGLERPSDANEIGRDTRRLSLLGTWQRSWANDWGMVMTATGELAIDQFHVSQDTSFPDQQTRVTPTLAAELRWPFEKSNGATRTVIEPVAQLVWSRVSDVDVPNEDSTVAEFDEASLFDLNRFAGRDQVEGGWRANFGVGWTRFDASGWTTAVTVGRVLREDDNTALAPGASATERASDWLTTVQLSSPTGLALLNRAQFSSDLSINKNVLRMGWEDPLSALALSYTWLRASEAESRPADTNEFSVTGRRRFNDTWAGGLEFSYDFDASQAREADLSLEYRNECVLVELSVSRDFDTSLDLRSTTDFGITVSLLGFGRGDDAARTSRCRG
ncbi:LPS assembly protein LptD [Dinoroseobacter sp. PD6]|uniref:LPS-assembly protein LptD n=1 Tax=Dinoroseobacter sp. PD6 TaxID=3028384 RepID=UPI00237BF74D|nr:LPS assembly protein LptD [Dinoroseobacter sp. PD6]MDD9716030.1 LPS assembly protein LptD [Dinoroseobacter sp. PD6]